MIKKVTSKKNRALLAELVRTDFKLRYQGSVLGYAWSLLRPLLLFLILYIVFAKFLRLGRGVEHFPIFLLLGIVLWTFFTDMTNQSLGSIVSRGDLIRKIRIPRWIIVLSSSVSALINLFLNLLIVLVFMIVNRVEFMGSVVYLPIILAEIYIFSLGLSLFLAAAYVKYRDISYIWEVILQAAFYASPIIYPLSLIPNLTFQKLVILSPIAQAIQDARNVVVTPTTTTIAEVYGSSGMRFVPLLISVAVLLFGIWYFRKEASHFAENL